VYFFWSHTNQRGRYNFSELDLCAVLRSYGLCTSCITICCLLTDCGFLSLIAKLHEEDDLLERQYHDDPDTCDFSELTVINNVVSGRKDVITLFWENMLGVDVDVRGHSLGLIIYGHL